MFGGIVEKDGWFFFGDWFMFVNDVNLENSSFEEVVEVLKGVLLGIVRIGVVKFLFFLLEEGYVFVKEDLFFYLLYFCEEEGFVDKFFFRVDLVLVDF